MKHVAKTGELIPFENVCVLRKWLKFHKNNLWKNCSFFKDLEKVHDSICLSFEIGSLYRFYGEQICSRFVTSYYGQKLTQLDDS